MIKLQRILSRELKVLRKQAQGAGPASRRSISCKDMVEKVDPFFAFQSRIYKRPSDVGRTSSPCPMDVISALQSPLPVVDRGFEDLLAVLEMGAVMRGEDDREDSGASPVP